MDIGEVKKMIVKAGIPESLYYVGEGLPSEAFCIYEKEGVFVVYYSERGCRRGERKFTKAEEAVNYLLPKLIKYKEGCSKRIDDKLTMI